MYSLVLSREARKTFLKIPGPIATLIRSKLEQLRKNPYAANNNIKKLQSREGYRLRIGDWRVIYTLQDKKMEVLVIKVALRGEIYQ